LSIRQYDDKDGNKRQATEVVINTMQMLGGPRDRQDSGDQFAGASVGGAGRMDDALDEEIPF
jgi:single-stranded DNA-binding protein